MMSRCWLVMPPTGRQHRCRSHLPLARWARCVGGRPAQQLGLAEVCLPALHASCRPGFLVVGETRAGVPTNELPLLQVLPYLLRLAFGEAQLSWRLAVALALLVT